MPLYPSNYRPESGVAAKPDINGLLQLKIKMLTKTLTRIRNIKEPECGCEVVRDAPMTKTDKAVETIYHSIGFNLAEKCLIFLFSGSSTISRPFTSSFFS